VRTGPREGIEPICPFCRSALPRPAERRINSMETVLTGSCGTCGAVYMVDPTSKNVGEVMMQALDMVASQLSRESASMTAGEDYDDAVLSYDWRTHRSSGEPKSFMDGHGRMYIIKVKKGKN
jgi:hypothetical protein